METSGAASSGAVIVEFSVERTGHISGFTGAVSDLDLTSLGVDREFHVVCALGFEVRVLVKMQF